MPKRARSVLIIVQTESEDYMQHQVLFKLDTNMNPEYLFGYTGGNVYFSPFTSGITINVNDYDYYEILPFEDCSSGFQISPTSDFVNHFQENLSFTPHLTLTYNYADEELRPLMFGPQCVSQSHLLETIYGATRTSRSPVIDVDFPGIFCVGVGAYQSITENWVPSLNFQPRAYADVGNAVFEYISNDGIVVSGLLEPNRYHGGSMDFASGMNIFFHNVEPDLIEPEIFVPKSPKNGQNMPNITFSPSILTSEHYHGAGWIFMCHETDSINCESGVFITGAGPDYWERGKPSEYPSQNMRGGFYQNPFHNNAKYSNDSLLVYHGQLPYIYDPLNSIEGVLIPDDEQHVILLVRGELSKILKPFERIGFDETPIIDDENTDDQNSGNGDELCEAGIYANLQASRTCNIPQGDMDWDGLPDEPSSGVEADEDRDGDGKMDLIELSDSIVGTDVDSMDMSVISSPDLDFVHSITATTGTNQIEIIVEYKMTMSEMMIVLPLIAYTNENGTENDMTDWNLNSATELNRLEQQMCISPNTYSILDDELQPISHWLENFSFDGQTPPFNWECQWVERRSVDLMMDFMVADASQIANWKETIRYTLILDTFDTASENTIIHLPKSNGMSGKVWELKVETPSNEQALIYHPWIEKGTLVAPNPAGDQTSQDDTSGPATPAVTPTYTSAWSIIVDVKEGSVDCSGYSDSVNDDVSWDDLDSLYQQNDIDYNSLSSYHEYSNYDDNIYVSCSGNVNFEQAMDGMEDDFCAYLFLYGELKQSKCDSGSFTSVTLSGQKTTLQEDLDDFEQDLADLENQWQNDLDDLFNTDDNSGTDDFGAEIDNIIDNVLIPVMILLGILAVIAS